MMVIYEIVARLSDATRLSRQGWDQGYAIGIATAAGVCNFLKLSPELTGHAIGIAATCSLPLRVTRSGELTSWKNVAIVGSIVNTPPGIERFTTAFLSNRRLE